MTLTKILPLLVLTFSFISNFSPVKGQNNTRGEYFIIGTIKGISSGTVRMFSSDGNKLIDSALIVDGTFYMEGKVSEPERLLFTISPGNWNFRAFVENASIKLAVDTTGALYQGKGTNKWALIWEIEETGSAFADIYEEYIKATNQQYYAAIISSLREKNKAVKDDTVASKDQLSIGFFKETIIGETKSVDRKLYWPKPCFYSRRLHI